MGLEEDVARVVSELQTGVDRSLFGSLTVMRTRLIKSAQARAQLLRLNASKLLLDLLGEKARHGRQTKLPDLVMSILANLCLDNLASEQILKYGGLETIANFTLAAEQESVQNRGVRALSNLARHEGVVEELFNLEVPEFVTMRLLETEDEECRVTYCRAIRQIGKTDSSVRRLVEDTLAVQALATMLKLDNKTLALKGLRTLAELSALRCCAQFAGQVLAAKVEEELVTFSKDEEKDMAYFSLSLIYRLCEQGVVRPSLGAAGVVKLLVRLMSNSLPHVNRVSVLNSLCLCSMDSVNRNRIFDAGALEVFMSVLNGEVSAQAIGRATEGVVSDSNDGGMSKTLGSASANSTSHSSAEDKNRALGRSQFRVLYDRIIGCLVNFIYHDKCFTKLMELGLVDVLLMHLQRCSNYQVDNYTDIKGELGNLESVATAPNQDLQEQIKIDKTSLMENSQNESESDEIHATVSLNSQQGADNSGPVALGLEFQPASNSPGDAGVDPKTERIRHESKGFQPLNHLELQPDTGIEQETHSNSELDSCNMIQEEIREKEQEDEEEKISQSILSRDPLNIDSEDINYQSSFQRELTPPKAAESLIDSFSREPDTQVAPSRKIRHTFSINSPSYQSEISRRSEEDYGSGVTCKDFSHSRSLLSAQGSSPNNMLSPSWPASPESGLSSRISSPAGFQSPYSPLHGDASYYSPTQSSPPYSEAPFSPPFSLSHLHSPSSSSYQASPSPALSLISSSLPSPGQRSVSSPSPLHIPPYQSPQVGGAQGSFSPLSIPNYPGSPLSHMADEAGVQGLEANSTHQWAGVTFQGSPGLFSDTHSQDDAGTSSAGQSQVPQLSLEAGPSMHGTHASSSPMYSATDDEDDEDEEDKKILNKSGAEKNYSHDGEMFSESGKTFRENKDEPSDMFEMVGTDCIVTPDSEELDVKASQTSTVNVNGCLKEQGKSHIGNTNKAARTLNRAIKRSSSLDCYLVDSSEGRSPADSDQSPKRSRLNCDLSLADPSLSAVMASPQASATSERAVAESNFSASPLLNQSDGSKMNIDTKCPDSSQTNQPQLGIMEKLSSRDTKKLVPRSSKVSKRFERMLSTPCLETVPQSQRGFKKRSSLPQQTIAGDVVTTSEESWASPCEVLSTASSQMTSFSSPSSTHSLAFNQEDATAIHSPRQRSNKLSAASTSRHREQRGGASDEKLKRILQTTESNIFILLSSCSVRPGDSLKLIKPDVLANLLTYIRKAPSPLQRCFRILKRLFSNQIIFPRLILAQASTLIIQSLILQDDGTFPAAMFCAEWEDPFSHIKRSRMNLSDLLPFSKSSDDGGTTASQASDFGQRLDFEFRGDAYNMASTLSTGRSLAHRMFRYLYPDIRSSSTDSQNALDVEGLSHRSDLIYVPGVSRVETRVRVGLKLLGCLSTVATSSYGEGEIQHLMQRGHLAEMLSCRIFMLHVPLVWGRIIRHQFALKHQPDWEALLPYLFMEKMPVVVKTAILTGLSFNLHLDFPPKLVQRVIKATPFPNVSSTTNSEILISNSTSFVTKSHSVVSNLNAPSGSAKHSGKESDESESDTTVFKIGGAGPVSSQGSDKRSCSKETSFQEIEMSTPLSPLLFDNDEDGDGKSSQAKQSQHYKCLYWKKEANHDVTFIIKDDGITYRHGANRSTMMGRSEVFAAMLGGAYAERLKTEIKLADTKAVSFESILHYLHGCTSSTCSLLSFLSSTVSQLTYFKRTRPNVVERSPFRSGTSVVDETPLVNRTEEAKQNTSPAIKAEASLNLDCIDCEDSLDSLTLVETPTEKDSERFPPEGERLIFTNTVTLSETALEKDLAKLSHPSSTSTTKDRQAILADRHDQTPDSKIKAGPGTQIRNANSKKPDSGSNIVPRNREEALALVEELINICSDVLVLADRYLLTDLVSNICSVLSHVCLHSHTWEDLFKLASVFKQRPLAVDCIREALTAHVKPVEVVQELQNLREDGYADQVIEALGLLLKSARIH